MKFTPDKAKRIKKKKKIKLFPQYIIKGNIFEFAGNCKSQDYCFFSIYFDRRLNKQICDNKLHTVIM